MGLPFIFLFYSVDALTIIIVVIAGLIGAMVMILMICCWIQRANQTMAAGNQLNNAELMEVQTAIQHALASNVYVNVNAQAIQPQLRMQQLNKPRAASRVDFFTCTPD